MLGWMAATWFGSLTAEVFDQVFPESVVRSKCTRHPPSSVLLGQRISPFGSWTGLFLIGPRMPFGSRRGDDQVLPPSAEVINIPHHFEGLGPTL